jgi:phosphatidylinositol alpha-1,6-mannosyltransferase
MDILVVSWNFPPRRGGIEYLIGGLCDGLKKKHSVRVVSSYSATAETTGEAIFRPRWPGLFVFFLYAFARGALLLRRDTGIGVILGGSALVTPLVLMLARLFKRKAVVLTHGLDLSYPSMLYNVLCLRWLKLCDRVIANSRHTAGLARETGARESAIRVIPPGLHWERFTSFGSTDLVKEELGLTDRKIVLFVGRLARRKGVKEFIKQSLPRIVQTVRDVCFVIVGGNPTESLAHSGDLVGEITAIVAELGLEKHVRLLGRLDDEKLTKVLQIADVLVLPVLSMKDDVEGFGIVLLEAAAAGIPAVATRLGGIPDAIEQGKSGILVEPDNYEELSQSVIGLLTDRDERERLGEYAKWRVKEKFSWDKIIARYESVLSDLFARSG